MRISVRYLGGTGFEAKARRHRVICDQPAENGGRDTGMSPPELLLSSLGACAGYYATQYLAARSLPAENLRIEVEAQKCTQPARLCSFRVLVHAPELEERHQAGLLRAIHLCLIHNTLTHLPNIEVSMQSGPAWNMPAGDPAIPADGPDLRIPQGR
jgi:uncharacterized OsmC-like protein